MKLIIFGTGEYYRRCERYLDNHSIIAFADNDISKVGKIINGAPVITPADIKKYEYDYICILSSYQDEISEQLESLSISENQILRYTEIGLLERQKNVYRDREPLRESDVILVSPQITYGGAGLALFHFALVLKEMGFSCVVLTVFDGSLRKEFEENRIQVYEEKFLDSRNDELFTIVRRKRLIIVNSMCLRHFVSSLYKISVPVIWWIHESIGDARCEFKPYQIKTPDRLYTCTVGKLAKKMIENKFSNLETRDLLYMVDENTFSAEKIDDSKITFAIIGSVTKFKGQDIFVKAVELLTTQERRKCSFWIIGAPVDNGLYEELKLKASDIRELSILGPLDRENLRTVYRSIDVVISASTLDTMPTVIVEAMMNKRCCIVSPCTGIVGYIENYKSGIILDEVSDIDLCRKMRWVMNNYRKSIEIGENSYEIYKEYFSAEVFKKNIKAIIEEVG